MTLSEMTISTMTFSIITLSVTAQEGSIKVEKHSVMRCLTNNIVSVDIIYLTPSSEANVIKLFCQYFVNVCGKLECLPLSSLFSLV
jgi:hypothetical protein